MKDLNKSRPQINQVMRDLSLWFKASVVRILARSMALIFIVAGVMAFKFHPFFFFLGLVFGFHILLNLSDWTPQRPKLTRAGLVEAARLKKYLLNDSPYAIVLDPLVGDLFYNLQQLQRDEVWEQRWVVASYVPAIIYTVIYQTAVLALGKVEKLSRSIR